MTLVQFESRERYDLGAQIVEPLGARLSPDTLSLIVDHAGLATLLNRLSRGVSTILPRRHHLSDEWIVVAPTQRELEAILVSAGRFVVPTYAELEGGVPTLRTFDPHGDSIERIGAQLYPAGCYHWITPPSYFALILERLALWSRLDDARPQGILERSPSYRDLLDQFSASLSAGAWAEANAFLESMRRLGLGTADNLLFLEIQLLAQQRRWIDIWRRIDFPDIAHLRTPRSIRAALLTALHQGELLELEQQGRWAEALEAFRRARPRSGSLLDGPPDMSYGLALRVFAYRAAAEADRRTIEALQNLPLDEETRRVVEALFSLVPISDRPTPVALPALTPVQALRQALSDAEFDVAIAAASLLEDPAERAVAMLEIAYLSEDPSTAEEALLQLWGLSDETQAMLLQRSRKISQIVALLSASLPASAPAIDEDLPRDWVSWLAAANANPDDPRLSHALEAVSATTDRAWTSDHLVKLSDQLVALAASGAASGRAQIRSAVSYLRDHFLQDLEFPRDRSPYDEIYEALYLMTLEQHDVNEPMSMSLLRLAEARLRRSPVSRNTIAGHLMGWFDDPFPALEGAAQEALELLAVYGVQGPTLTVWYRAWAEALLASPRSHDRLTLEGWLDLGRWVQPGDDLLDRLHRRLTDALDDKPDPVMALPAGYHIAIFTLRPQSAERVGALLRHRNSSLEVSICDDTVLTDRALALVRGAQLVVVVTTCITHALTYGIGPYLQDPVYPQSNGSTSILRAVEARLVQN